MREFDVAQAVLVRNLREGPKWVHGTIVEQTGPVSYRVQVSDQIWRCHTDQILDCSGTKSNETETPVPDMVCSQVPSPADTAPVPQPLDDSVPLSNTEHHVFVHRSTEHCSYNCLSESNSTLISSETQVLAKKEGNVVLMHVRLFF